MEQKEKNDWSKINRAEDTCKHTNICIMWVPEENEKNKNGEIILEEIVGKNFPRWKILFYKCSYSLLNNGIHYEKCIVKWFCCCVNII